MEKGENGDISSIGIPIGTDFERWKFIVRGLKQLNADTKSIDGKDLENLTKVNYTTISGNLKLLHQIEFVTEDSKASAIKLTANGLEFAQALIMKDENKQKELLSKPLRKVFKDVLAFYELHIQNNDLSFEMLFNQIKLLSNSPEVDGKSGNTHPGNRTGIYTVLKMLIFTELITEKFDPQSNAMQVLQDKSGKPRSKSKIPLSCSVLWMTKLFQEVRNMNPPTIKREFITANVVRNHHEGSVLFVARFIGLIDKDGNRSENYDKLRLFGDNEFKQNLAQIIKEKYDKIFSITNIETVERKSLEIVFMKEYELGNDQARNGVNVLVNLCQLSNLSISESLLNSKQTTQKESNVKKTKINKEQKLQSVEPSVQSNMPPSIMYPMPESPFKVNLNINIDVKDKETMHGVIELVRGLKQEIKSLPKLGISVNEQSSSNED